MQGNARVRRLGLAAVTGLALGLSVGCAQERAPINQVQADALSKHFFVGPSLSLTSDDPEFYMRNTVIDVPYSATQSGLFTATYAQPLTRVKWEITQDSLIARQTYELVQDSDFNGARTTDKGQVVAMFTISSHFDIKRSYNPQTGEENNVITENTTDRPWYEREYIRVDWSKNLVTDGYAVDTLSSLGIIGGVKWDPEAYYVSDPADPNAPVFNQDDGYFDVTQKAFASPQLIDTPYGSYPACFFRAGDEGIGNPAANCNATEVTLRLSFRVKPDTDFEPEDQTGVKQYAFGWFTQDRYGYDRNYGVLDDDWHRFASKYNLWQQSHVQGSQCAVDYWRDTNGTALKYQVNAQGEFLVDGTTGLPIPDPNGKPFAGTPPGADVHRDVNKNGTEDDCEFTGANGQLVNPGSRCDEFSQKCDLPLYSRQTKKIPWYFGPQSDTSLFASTANALGQWNLAVKRAALIGKVVELKRVGLDPSPVVNGTDAHGAPIDLTTEAGLVADAGHTVSDVFVLCHNPVVTGDDPSCGAPGLVARVGDIRYNMVNIIPTPQSGSPWGIMVDADDPLTGEKVVTSVNEWGAVLDIAAQGTEDLIRWIDGEISDSQITSGQYLKAWVNADKLGTAPHSPKTLSAAEVQTRLNSIDLGLSKLVQLPASMKSQPRALQLQAAASYLGSALGPSLDSQFEGTRQSLIGTKWEAQLATPNWLQASGQDPSTPIAGNDTALAQASSLRGMNPMLSAWVDRQRNTTMAHWGSCQVGEPEPDSLVGLARLAVAQYPLPKTNDPEYAYRLQARQSALHQWIREQFHTAVIAHEMGHSMGLRHNFTGSFDPLNYHTQYWQLRSRNGAEHACPLGTAAQTDGTTCLGPRWIDPVTDAETNGLIWKWGSSTVMDYPGDVTQDMNDIGPYDKAAMRFGYADVVDVDTDATLQKVGGSYTINFNNLSDKGSAFAFALDGFGGITGQTIGLNHYSTYADKYGILGTCGKPTNPSDPLTATCSGPPLDYVAQRDMISVGKFGAASSTSLAGTTASFAVDPKGRVRHPYMFGSDEFADFGNVPVFRFDAGGDSYEQYQFLISTYENRYVFDNFRRDRALFNTSAVVARTQSRYFDKIQGMTKSLALLVGLEGAQASAALNDPGQLMPLALGASDGLKMFARVLTRPEPGPYGASSPPMSPFPNALPFQTALQNFLTLPTGAFTVPLGSGQGRFIENDYDYNQGYYWSDYQKQVGSAYEKDLAIWYLTEAHNEFISNTEEDYIDGRYKNLSYASLYPNQVQRLISQLLTNDPMTYGPYVSVTGANSNLASDGTVQVQYLPWEQWDATNPATTNLDYPAGAIVLDPLMGWERQYRMVLQLFYMGQSSLTMNLIDQMRIFSPGDAAGLSIDPTQQIIYRDPGTGIEYEARNYGMEQVNSRVPMVNRSMGARMLQYANQLAAATYQIIGKPDAATGELTYVTDANGQPVCAVASATCFANATALSNYSANIDTVREMALYLGYGPQDGNPPKAPPTVGN